MRVALAQLAPVPGDLGSNLQRIDETVRQHPADLYVFPELFLSGYRIGDRLHELALAPGDPAFSRLASIAERSRATLVVGAPLRHERAGELENAAVLIGPDGAVESRGKRFLPTFGPFEEGSVFTPSGSGRIATVAGRSYGVQICYDAFFPEVSRDLAAAGAEVLLVLSAAPVTSRRLFDRVLPARAVENALPVVYVNRSGVEDGIVFGGGSQSLDARGELLDPPEAPATRSDEGTWVVEIDPSESARWRPFRPVLRDIAPHRAGRASAGNGDRGGAPAAARTGPL